MSTILTFLGNLRLSLTQIAVIAGGLMVSGLLITVEVTLSRLHSTQTKLLEATYGNDVSEQDRAVAHSRATFLKALKAYRGSR